MLERFSEFLDETVFALLMGLMLFICIPLVQGHDIEFSGADIWQSLTLIVVFTPASFIILEVIRGLLSLFVTRINALRIRCRLI